MYKTLLIVCCLLGWGCEQIVQTDGCTDIIPKPVSVQTGNGVFLWTSHTSLGLSRSPNNTQKIALEELKKMYSELFSGGLRCVRNSVAVDAPSIRFQYDSTFPLEAYRLRVTPDTLLVVASHDKGLFYAMQTLRQLIPTTAYGKEIDGVEIPVVDIYDEPSFGYRGMLFDVCRHFFSVDDVKTTIDILARHKMNRLHWHLTDDQGWRIEIKKYPRLAEVASVRSQTVLGHNTGEFDGVPYGGYYTQEEIKDIVQYAEDHYVTIIPEIELPGHAVAALTAYPSLGCRGKDYEVWTEWGVNDQVFCVGNDSTLRFLEDVLTEVISLFPSEYIHIGGDECPTSEWEKCPKCCRRMQVEHLKTPRGLQGYLTKHIERFLNAHGRKIIGWDEILDGGVTPNATIMSWRGTEGGIKAAQMGNYAIMSPEPYCYLNRYQVADHSNEPDAFDAYLPLHKVYELNPVDKLTDEQKKYILGAQANLWTEYIPTYQRAQYMMLPRLSALAEVAWSNNRKDYSDFRKRLNHLELYYDMWGYEHWKSKGNVLK